MDIMGIIAMSATIDTIRWATPSDTLEGRRPMRVDRRCGPDTRGFTRITAVSTFGGTIA